MVEQRENWNMSRNNTDTHLELRICKKKTSSQVYKNTTNQASKKKTSNSCRSFLSKAFFTCFCLTICNENTCAEGSAGRGFFFISRRVLWSSSEPPVTSNISLLSRPTPDLMGQVPCQRQFWAWVLGWSGCHGQQRWITAWEYNAGIWIKKREFLVTGVKEKKPSSNCILQNTQRKI